MDEKIIRMQISDLAKAVSKLLELEISNDSKLNYEDWVEVNNLLDSIGYLIEK